MTLSETPDAPTGRDDRCRLNPQIVENRVVAIQTKNETHWMNFLYPSDRFATLPSV